MIFCTLSVTTTGCADLLGVGDLSLVSGERNTSGGGENAGRGDPSGEQGGTTNGSSETGGTVTSSGGATEAAEPSSGGGVGSTECQTTLDFDIVQGITDYFLSGLSENAAWQTASANRAPTSGYLWQIDTRGVLVSGTNVCADCAGTFVWYSNAGINGRGPVVAVNSTETLLNLSTVDTPPHSLFEHPGADCQYAAVFWTAPCSGTAEVTATYTGLADTSTDVHVLVRNEPVFSANITQYDATSLFKSTIPVVAGDSLAFIVGCGLNGDYYSDATAVAATIHLSAL